jgi:O-antigen ligase
MFTKLFVVFIFIGSLFITSDKFVNEINTPQLYFVLVSLLVLTIIVAIGQQCLNFSLIKCKKIIWGITIVCSFQACYGLFQFLGWFPSNHSKFAITGSFDNPAGFAAVLSMGFPIALFLLTKAVKVERYLTSAGLLVISITLFLSGSRAGVFAILLSSVVLLLFQTKIMGKFKKLRYLKLLSALIIGILVSGAYILYYQKKDSANGRLLIWKVSSEMIKDKPILGHGFEAFQAKYMDYQAEYFKKNPNSIHSQLADNVKHPFNEFLKIVVEFGMIGLAIIISFVLFILRKIVKSKDENRGLVLSGLLSFMVFASFSYPLQYVAVWLLLAFYLLALLPSNEIRIRNTPISITVRAIVVIGCALILFYFIKQIQAEIKWKAIAVNSLKGNTEKMLPEYEKLYSSSLKRNPFFLYNYGAELNFTGNFDKSIEILTICQKKFNDYDLQMILADNYYRKGDTGKAVQIYKNAALMIPCRFLPLYQLFVINRKAGNTDLAVKYANMIVNKKIKIESSTVIWIKAEAKEYLKGN